MRATLRKWHQICIIPVVSHNVSVHQMARIKKLKGHQLSQVTLLTENVLLNDFKMTIKMTLLNIQAAAHYNFFSA